MRTPKIELGKIVRGSLGRPETAQKGPGKSGWPPLQTTNSAVPRTLPRTIPTTPGFQTPDPQTAPGTRNHTRASDARITQHDLAQSAWRICWACLGLTNPIRNGRFEIMEFPGARSCDSAATYRSGSSDSGGRFCRRASKLTSWTHVAFKSAHGLCMDEVCEPNSSWESG